MEDKEESNSSYSRLFNNGNNVELADSIGSMFTHIQSETIKQGNKLEDFIVEFIDKETGKKVFREKKQWYKNRDTLEEIIKDKEIINKCFIPKSYLDKYELSCGNKTGIELDFVIVKPDKKLILVEMKAGRDFDTKKSKGEVDSILNIKSLFEKNGIEVEKALFVSYEAKSVDDINFKTDLKGCEKNTFLPFLREIFDNETALNGKSYIERKFQEQANNHIVYLKNKMQELIEKM